MPSFSSSGFTIQNSPERLNSPRILTSIGPTSSGSWEPITWSSKASPASLLPRFFEPTKPGRVNGHDRRAEALRGAKAHGVEIVADQRGHAGRIDEHRRRRMRLDDLADGLEELLLALAHHHVELGEVGGEAHPPEARAGRRGAAIVPGIAFAGERPMDEMRDVGDRLKHDLGAVEGAAARRRAGRQRFRAALLARARVLGLVLVAGRFLKEGLDAGLAATWGDPREVARRRPCRRAR